MIAFIVLLAASPAFWRIFPPHVTSLLNASTNQFQIFPGNCAKNVMILLIMIGIFVATQLAIFVPHSISFPIVKPIA